MPNDQIPMTIAEMAPQSARNTLRSEALHQGRQKSPQTGWGWEPGRPWRKSGGGPSRRPAHKSLPPCVLDFHMAAGGRCRPGRPERCRSLPAAPVS